MNKLRAIELFVRLTEVGSFTRLAEQQRTSKSMVSKEISRLEQELGARLLHRTTRNIQLTYVGEEYLKYANEILAKIENADAFVKTLAQAPRGKIKVNAPMALGITDLSMLFADFMQAFPDVDLDIHLGDENIDLVAEGFDLGFRASSQTFDSNYIGKALCEFNYHLCASRDYFSHHAPIQTKQDLLQHNCFEYSYFKGKNVWPVDGVIATSGSLRVNSVLFMLQVIKAGRGIGYLPEFVCRELLENGQLVEVLPDSEKSKLTLYALYPARQFVPPAVLQCINFVERWFERNKP
ncbi:LysR family transcriptional regulator [Vibrio orientalis CIP 102891 = ATCC 33934]|uniref:LysR family transcriptional regulator n=1 Tax=Vibrio orientalis CIP 102891 = ATCC 33934 TaxID=675816 RepID=C9QLT7_VIBOR|nr:LysR family transcriptional regulator [Vibrio orientalis]EEX92864.1 transcriptional regulator LysR family [Vibrio orientalis CIP 102891 = ATCC 33934]EGU46545.1 LysR family transcriptional regulator [Vibrio orientalis CIP 102891 = ATCC 33934]